MSCLSSLARIPGTFEVIFNQTSPLAVSNAGSGTFTALIGAVTSYDFDFSTPSEEFSGPPNSLTLDGTRLNGFDFAEYIAGATLQGLESGI